MTWSWLTMCSAIDPGRHLVRIGERTWEQTASQNEFWCGKGAGVAKVLPQLLNRYLHHQPIAVQPLLMNWDSHNYSRNSSLQRETVAETSKDFLQGPSRLISPRSRYQNSMILSYTFSSQIRTLALSLLRSWHTPSRSVSPTKEC